MNGFKKLLKNQKGVFIVFTAVLLPVIFACAGLAMDLGNAFAHKSKLQNAADAAALAGAAEFAKQNETVDRHPLADTMAGGYANLNYGKNFATGDIKRQAQTKEEKSYYRVYLKDQVPVTFMRILGFGPTMTVSVDAIATIPVQGTADVGGGQLMNIGSQIGGSFYNGNNDHNSTVRGSTFDGSVIVYDKAKYDEYKNNQWGSYYFYKPEASGMKVTDAINQKLYTEPIYAGDQGKDYTTEKNKLDKEIKSLFDKKQSEVKVIKDKQNCSVPESGETANYYKVFSDNSGNLSIDLRNPPGNKEEPIYIYVSETVGFLKIQLQENITRPVIIYYERNANVQFMSNNHDFRGVLCAPNAWVSPFSFESGKFSGSLWAQGLELNTNHGQFKFESFGNSNILGGSTGGGSGSSGGGSTASVELKLVDGSGLTWAE